jgi:hypothetical protein
MSEGRHVTVPSQAQSLNGQPLEGRGSLLRRGNVQRYRYRSTHLVASAPLAETALLSGVPSSR